MLKSISRTIPVALAGGIAAAVAMSGAASAQDTGSGNYLSLGAGLSWSKDRMLNSVFPAGATGPAATTPVARSGSTDFNTGYNIVGAFGHKWDSGLRGELEFGFRRNALQSLYGATSDGSKKTGSVMANVLYDFNTGASITPYVGAGLGAGRQQWTHTYGVTSAPDVHVRDTAFQWQLIGGVALPVSAKTSLFAEYRYISLENVNYRTMKLAPSSGQFDDRSHNALVGVRFHL
jgi:opacity protein-like surface antigen